MKIPNGEQAVIDMRKIEEYCLSEEHDDGRHKARLFRDILGISLDNYHVLVDALRQAVVGDDAEEGKLDSYGQRWLVDFDLQGPTGSATVRSVWIVLAGETTPRLVTCYIM